MGVVRVVNAVRVKETVEIGVENTVVLAGQTASFYQSNNPAKCLWI